jgi:hypothetical protein
MKANMDAGLAAELAPDYAKAHYRKGLSLVRRRLANAPPPPPPPPTCGRPHCLTEIILTH